MRVQSTLFLEVYEGYFVFCQVAQAFLDPTTGYPPFAASG